MGFVLKRKRSDSELSVTSSQFSSPPRQHMFSPMRMDADCNSPSRPRSSTPSHLPSRTMKRFRDNRPSDEEVHRHTLNLLYKAQSQNSHISDNQKQHQQPTVASPFPWPVENTHKPQGQQSSLHRFFNIPGSEPSSTASSLPPVMEAQSCEDCGSRACGSDSDDTMMDVDEYGFDSSPADCRCVGCGKVVCSQCSVSILGEQRRCLVCAGKKVWVGGI